MQSITLIVLPGGGERTVAIESGTTLQEVVSQQGLQNRNICVDGEDISSADFSSYTLLGGEEVTALNPVKGNS